jgi:hypothetical protein
METEHLVFGPDFKTDRQRNEEAKAKEAEKAAPVGKPSKPEAAFDKKIDAIDQKADTAKVGVMAKEVGHKP